LLAKGEPGLGYEAIVIGGSAGGFNALQEILRPLPADFELPILVVLHRSPSPDQLLIYTLNESCQLLVKEADQDDVIEPGRVYIAPANYHLLVERDRTLSLSIDAKVCYSRPSIDVLFETASDAYLAGLIGIILTGANNDGTAGLRQIKRNGGLTIAQDPATASSKLMPSSAIEENIVDQVVSLTALTATLIQFCTKGLLDE
jgi:two-component system chemotaxis response regulator CheB